MPVLKQDVFVKHYAPTWYLTSKNGNAESFVYTSEKGDNSSMDNDKVTVLECYTPSTIWQNVCVIIWLSPYVCKVTEQKGMEVMSIFS